MTTLVDVVLLFGNNVPSLLGTSILLTLDQNQERRDKEEDREGRESSRERSHTRTRKRRSWRSRYRRWRKRRERRPGKRQAKKQAKNRDIQRRRQSLVSSRFFSLSPDPSLHTNLLDGRGEGSEAEERLSLPEQRAKLLVG